MEGRLLFKNCALVRTDGRVREGMAVLVEEGRVTRVVPDAAMPVLPGDWAVACRGRLLSPGLVDCHAHLVAGQLQPLTAALLAQPPSQQRQLVQRLETELTPGEVEALTAHALSRALSRGITLSVEHLHAPRSVGPCLEAQARTARQLGARVVLSHATDSLGGEAHALAQLEANAAFCVQVHGEPLVRGALGFDASCTAGDALLERAGRLREQLEAATVFHLAESEEDLAQTFAAHGQRVVHRLEAFGLLGPGGVAAGARALDRSECALLSARRTLLALSPAQARLGEPVGGAGLDTLVAHQVLLGLGSSGTGSLQDELEAALAEALVFTRAQRLLDPDELLSHLLVGGPAELCSLLFGAPSGSVEEGSLADLVLYDWVPQKRPDGTLGPLLARELVRARVAWTVVEGRVAVREGQLLGQDALELAREAARALESLWARVPLSAVGGPLP
jgi:5-methylthioadenosine/S-adenosylhomocysteine deaminase